jgi:hypothetical protein
MRIVQVGEQVWRELAAPRAPTDAERRVLGVLAAAAGDPRLRDQVASVVVDAVCRCGCSSVRLRADGPAGSSGHRAVEAIGSGPGHEHVQVVLHVLRGRLHELEVFDTFAGEGVPVALEDLPVLGAPAVG